MVSVSIIVPNYNHAAFLRQRLDSIFSQSFQDFEVILLDDFSTDSSVHVLNEYKTKPQVSFVQYNSRNSGSPFVQWQKGLNYSKGEFIWIAESDDFCESNWLEKMFFLINQHPKVGLAYSGTNYINEQNVILDQFAIPERLKQSYINNGKDEVENFLSRDYCPIVNVSAVLFRRPALEESIKFVTDFNRSGDWMLYVKILKHYDIAFIPDRMNYFRFDPNKPKILFDRYVYLKERLRILRFIATDFNKPSHLDHYVSIILEETVVSFKREFQKFSLKGMLKVLDVCLEFWAYHPIFSLRAIKKIVIS